MAYKAYVTQLQNVEKAPNSDNLYIGRIFWHEQVITNDIPAGTEVLYLPSDGELFRWFGDELSLFRKNEDGTPQGGYIDDNGHIRAIRLRGNRSDGIVITLDRIYEIFGDQGWKVGDEVDEVNGEKFCTKYIPKRSAPGETPKTSVKGKKAFGLVYPEFDMHVDTEQLMYHLDAFQPGDIISLSLKMHGTSQRTMNTYAEYPLSWFCKLFHMKPKRKDAIVCGTRRRVTGNGGYYGSDEFRKAHHNRIAEVCIPGMEIFYEVVGYYGPGEADTIMPIGKNSKLHSKEFEKQFGPRTVFSYGCQPGESEAYIYRISVDNGNRELTPEEIVEFCREHNLKAVPFFDQFEFTTQEDLLRRVDEYLSDIVDPIGGHVKEGVVVRIVNRRKFTAYKSKTFEFKVLEGIIKEGAAAPDMEEAEEG